MSETTTTTTTPPAPHESALHAHLRAVLHRIEEVKTFAVDGLKKVGIFIEEEAPVVAQAAAAVASVIPVVGPAAAVVAKVAGEAAAAASAVTSCTCNPVHDRSHGPTGCTVAACGCAATTNPPPHR